MEATNVSECLALRSGQVDQSFRLKPTTFSGRFRPRVPVQSTTPDGSRLSVFLLLV